MNAKMQEHSLNQREISIKLEEKEVRKQRNKNKEYLHSLKTKEKDLNSLINDKAKEIYQNEKKRLKVQIKAPLFIISYYAILITVLKILDSKVLLSDISEFFDYIWNFILGFPSRIMGIFTYSMYDEGGSNEFILVVISVFDIAIMVLKLGLIVLGIGIIIGVVKLTIKYYKQEISIYIFMLDLAVVVFLGERIKTVVDMNLILLFMFIYLVYLFIFLLKKDV